MPPPPKHKRAQAPDEGGLNRTMQGRAKLQKEKGRIVTQKLRYRLWRYRTRTSQSILINETGERGRSSRPGIQDEIPYARLGLGARASVERNAGLCNV